MSQAKHSPPNRRASLTQRMQVGGVTIFLGMGEYANGELSEIFLDSAKAGSGTRGYMRSLALAISIGLQHGVPLSEYVEALRGLCFPPCGAVQGHRFISHATSPVDAVARELGLTYLEDSSCASQQ